MLIDFRHDAFKFDFQGLFGVAVHQVFVIALDALTVAHHMLAHCSIVFDTIAIFCSSQVTLDHLETSLFLKTMFFYGMLFLHALCCGIMSIDNGDVANLLNFKLNEELTYIDASL